MNEPLTPQNPEEDDIRTENLGNPQFEELTPNSVDQPGVSNSQNPPLVNANPNNMEQLNQLFRELRVFQPLKEAREATANLDERTKIQVQRLTNKIYILLVRALEAKILKVRKSEPYHWDALQETWKWMQERYDPDYPNANPYHCFNNKYKKMLIEVYRKAEDVRRKKNPNASDSDPNQPRTINIYPIRLDESIRDDEGSGDKTRLDNLDNLPAGELPEEDIIRALIKCFQSKPEILRQTPCFPRKKDSPTALDVALLLVEYYERGEGCTLQKLQARLGLEKSQSPQFYDFYRNKFIPLVREHFQQSEYYKYYNGEQEL